MIARWICEKSFWVALVLCIGSLLPLTAAAQQAGISFKPASVEKLLTPGSSYEYVIDVENLDTKVETFYVFTRNIAEVTEGGAPVFADQGERTGYELAEWITLPVTELVITPGQSAQLPVRIDVPEDAAPCGHFGGVFFSVEPPDVEITGAAVGYQAASIASIRVAGDCVEQASIRQFSSNKFLYGSQDVTFNVRVENTGNVLVRPRGPLEIYNSLGKKVDTIIFNDSQAAVFPKDTREFPNIRWQGDGIGFGRYEAVLSPAYGENGAIKTMSSTLTFWVLPMNIIGPALGILLFVLLVTFIAVRLYIKRAVAHLQQGNRRLVRRRKQGNSMTMLLVTSMLTVTALFLLVLLVLFA